MTESTEPTREIRFRKGYDHRDDPSGKRGAHGVEAHFILCGPLGVIQAVISTGWMFNPLAGPFVPGGPQRRRRGVGVDARLWDSYPTGSYVTSHVAQPPEGKDWFRGPDACDLLPEGACYGDTGYLCGDEFLTRLVRDGEDAAWEYLQEIHDDWLAPETVDASP